MIKKKLDKVMALMLSGTLALSLAACGSQPAETTESTETTSTTESVAGTQEASAEPPVLFESAYGSKAEALQAGLDLNVAIAEEGMILLKNEADALPLAKESKVHCLAMRQLLLMLVPARTAVMHLPVLQLRRQMSFPEWKMQDSS